MRQDKQLLLDDIKEQMDTAGSFVIMSYQQLKANLANDFRDEMAKIGSSVEMVPKRVLIKAAEQVQITLEHEKLPGHISLVLAGEEPFQTAKLVYKYSKKNGDVFTVLGGKFEGKLCDADQVKQLSELPTQDEMRAQLLGTFAAPLSQTLAVFNALLTSVPSCLQQKCDKDGNQ